MMNNIEFIKVPQNFLFARIRKVNEDIQYLRVTHEVGFAQRIESITLPPGNWQIIGLGENEDSLTEEFCENVVYHSPDHGYSNYGIEEDPYGPLTFETAKESMLSLIKAKGWYLVNPYGYEMMDNINEWRESESKTAPFLVLKEVK